MASKAFAQVQGEGFTPKAAATLIRCDASKSIGIVTN